MDMSSENERIKSIGTVLSEITRTMGIETLYNGKTTASVYLDLSSETEIDKRYAQRLLRCMYNVAEPEIQDLIRNRQTADEGIVSEKAETLIRKLDDSFVTRQAAEEFIMALTLPCAISESIFAACLNRVKVPSGIGKRKNELVLALKEMTADQGIGAWKDDHRLADIFKSYRKKDGLEERLFNRTCEISGGGLGKIAWAAMKKENERMLVAELQERMRSFFISNQNIDILLEAVLESFGLQYEQSLFPQTVSKPATAIQGGTSASGKNQVRRKQGTTSKQAASHSGAINQAGTARSGSAAMAGSSGNGSGASHRRSRLFPILGLLLMGAALFFLIRGREKRTDQIEQSQTEPGKTAVLEEADKKTTVEEKTETESHNDVETEGGIRYSYEEGAVDTSMTDLSVSTSSRQGGVYWANIENPSLFYQFTGRQEDFHFSYPGVMYNEVSFASNEDNTDIVIRFTCEEDPSALIVTAQKNESGTSEKEKKEELLNTALSATSEAQTLKNTEDLDSFGYYVRGYDPNQTDVTRCEIGSVSDGWAYTMTLYVPGPRADQNRSEGTDRAYKEFYIDCMYHLCGWSYATDERGLLKDYRKKYE